MADVHYGQNSYFENDLTARSCVSQSDTFRYAVLPEAAEGMDLDGADDWDGNEQRGYGERGHSEVPETFTMALPEGVSPGERLLCSAPDGKKLRLTIPPGVPAGSVMNLSRDTTSGNWTCVIDAPDDPHERPTYQAFHSSSAFAPIASAVPPLHRSTEQLLRTSLQAAGLARPPMQAPMQVHLSALHTPASSYGPSPCGSCAPSPRGSVSVSAVPPWPLHAAPPNAGASIRAASHAAVSVTGRGTLGLAPARAAPRVVTGGWASNASSRHSSPASTPRAHIVMPPSQSYTPPPVTRTPVAPARGYSSSLPMPGASQPQQPFSRSNSAISMQSQCPAAAPAAVSLHRQQPRASCMQGPSQAPRPMQPTKIPQEPQQKTNLWFSVAQWSPPAKQQQQQLQQLQQPRHHQQGQQKQQPSMQHQQPHSRAPTNRLSVKPVTQRRQRRSVCCAI